MSEAAPRPPPAEGRGGGRGGRRKGRGGGRGNRGGSRGKNDKGDASTRSVTDNQAKPPKSKRGGRKPKDDEGSAAAASNKPKGGGRSRRRGGNRAPQMTEQDRKREEEAKRVAAEKAAAEEERKRAEEAQKALEAAKEKRRQQQANLNTQVQEAIESLDHTVETTEMRKSRRAALAAEPLAAFRKSFQANKKSLKSDLKKCSAFVRKIKSGGAWSLTPTEIQKEMAALNLSRYVDEVASALLESKIKVADLPVVVALCVSMHERYPDFLPALLPSLWSIIQEKATEETVKTRRLYMRLVTEFLLNGVLTDAKPVVKIVGEATGGTAGNFAVSEASLVVSFVKAAGFEIIGTKPRSIQKDMQLLKQEVERAQQLQQQEEAAEAPVPAEGAPEEFPDATKAEGAADAAQSAVAAVEATTATPAPATENKAPIVISTVLIDKSLQALERVDGALRERALPPAVSEVLSTHCLGAYQTLSTSLVSTHGKLQKLEKRCEQDRLLSGTLSESREKGLTDARKLLESLQKSVEVLSDVLDQDMPVLQEEEEDEVEGSGVGVELWTKEGGDGGSFGPFDDEETRDFYCDIPDLLTTIPPALLGMTLDDVERIKAENIQKYGTGFDVVEEEEGDDADVTPSSEGDLDAAEALLEEADDDEEESKEKEKADTGEENKDTPHYKLMVLLEQELPECSRREQVDEVAEKFCVNHGASKNSRKRLSSTLFLVPRTRLDLLPYYSRMAAILDRVFPEVSSSLVTELEQQFHGQAKFKKNLNVESRLKTARYIGELTKFRVAPPIVALRCLRRCLDDFSGFNIDVACCLLESCGRYLYRTKHTEARLTALLDTMMRISKAKNLDERSVALIKSAFFMIKPPPAAPRKQAKVYPPLEAYLRQLLMVKLSPEDSSVAFVTKQLLRFPWSDPSKQCGALICKIMLKTCRRGRYKAIGAVASVVASMKRSKPEVPSRVVDGVLEELQWAMEHPSFREQQRTISYARLLGELHCASLVTTSVVLQQLYRFINFGHEIPEALKEASEKQIAAAESAEGADGEAKSPDLPVFKSAGGTTQTIHEDEEMDDEQLATNEEAEEEPSQPQVVAVSRHSVYDPRVPSILDPSSSVYRVTLVCTLLEASLPSLVTRSNLSRLEGFLAAFQRYLFTKDSLPTEVEFAVLDIFDGLDSRWKVALSKEAKGKKAPNSCALKQAGFQRYDTWIEAHNATIAVEEADALLERRTKAGLESLAGLTGTSPDGSASVADSVDTEDIENGLAMLDVDEEESVETSAKDSQGNFSDSEMESEEEDMSGSESDDDFRSEGTSDEDMSEGSNDLDEDSEDEDFSDEEELDEEAYARQLEAELFERELRRITMEALEKGKVAARKQVADTMPTGSQFVRKKPAAASSRDEKDEGQTFALGGQQGISLQLLKRGNKGKVEAKELVVPSDTNLAKVATKQDDEAARERYMLKARVLQYEAESAEQQNAGGNVYIEQQKLTVIRNRPLSMEVIDRNFGSTGGDYVDNKPGQGSTDKPRSHPNHSGRGRGGRGHGGRGGRGGGRGRSGRGLIY